MNPRTVILATMVALATSPLLAQEPAKARVESPAASDPVQAMRRSLLELASRQEMHFASAKRYSDNMTVLDFEPQGGARVRITEASAKGWSGVATHPGAKGKSCVVYFGTVAQPVTIGGTRAPRPAALTCD